jgi:putative membrane protein
MAVFMTAAAEAAFKEAIDAIEAVSSAEVVVAVVPRLRRWLIGHVIVGALLMFGVLAFELFSEDYEFELWSIAVTPLMTLVIGMLLVEVIAPLERLLTPRSVTDGFLREAGHAAFYAHGVHNTKGRSGVLVLVAVHEQRVMLVGDLAVVEHVNLAKHQEALTGKDGVAMAKTLAGFANDYATALPRAANDVNELGNLVHHVPHRSFRGSVR